MEIVVILIDRIVKLHFKVSKVLVCLQRHGMNQCMSYAHYPKSFIIHYAGILHSHHIL